MQNILYILSFKKKSNTCKTLQMGQNPITTEGAKAVVRAVQSAKDTSLIRVCLDVCTQKVTLC